MTNSGIAKITAETAAGIAARYIAAWNETDATNRQTLIAETFTTDARYVDPMVVCEGGHQGINAMIGAVQQRYAGLNFALRGQQDGHNDVVRFSWALGQPQNEPIACRTDVVVIAADGRIKSVTGFLDVLG